MSDWIMVLGDTHGNVNAAVKAVKKAKDHGVKRIVQVGDFGLWDHLEGGFTFVDTVNEALRKEGIKMYVAGGNHENWDRWNWYVENNPKNRHGFAYLRTHILLAPKTLVWTWNGKKCVIAAGAVSIDKAWRKPGVSWWVDEQLLDADVESIPFMKADYLFTHDCSNMTPFRERLKPDFDSQIHRQRIDMVLKRVKPDFHFHGHMHTKYDWMNRIDGMHYTQTYGLECDGMFYSWGLFDLESGEWKWAGSEANDWPPLTG